MGVPILCNYRVGNFGTRPRREYIVALNLSKYEDMVPHDPRNHKEADGSWRKLKLGRASPGALILRKVGAGSSASGSAPA